MSAALVLCALMVPLTPCPWLKKLHVIIQARGTTFDWPTSPAAQRDVFDFGSGGCCSQTAGDANDECANGF